MPLRIPETEDEAERSATEAQRHREGIEVRSDGVLSTDSWNGLNGLCGVGVFLPNACSAALRLRTPTPITSTSARSQHSPTPTQWCLRADGECWLRSLRLCASVALFPYPIGIKLRVALKSQKELIGIRMLSSAVDSTPSGQTSTNKIESVY